MHAIRIPLAAALLLLAAAPARAAQYDVGPGQPLAAIGDVPWATLAPGDVVRIHWRAEPYREKWVIGRSGTAEQPIVVTGVLGPGGERPVVSGDGATTPAPLNFWSEQRGVIKVGGSNVPDNEVAEHVVIENLEVRSAHASYAFTNDSGGVQAYAQNASAIFVEAARHLVIRNCVLTDSGNGLFVAASDGATRDLEIARNWIHGNGNAGSIYEHNAYVAAIGITFEGNRFGPLRAGAGGNNLKDRSAGLVVRYNWIEGGNRQLDLTDAEDSDVIVGDPRYRRTFVYGNVLIEPDGAGNRQVVHYGGDSGNEAIYRKGVLHFFHNTVVSTRAGRTSLLRLSTGDESADVRDNVVWVSAGGDELEMLADGAGDLALSRNWLPSGWTWSFATPTGSVVDDGTNLEASDPLFADADAQDYRLLPASDAVDAGGALHADALADHAVAQEYAPHQDLAARSLHGLAPELGAFETCAVACPEPEALASALAVGGALATFRRRA
ncbi:MAG: polysaccharide-degrading enzyme [Proteobacteria bacterium]|nr:MAG: polysaccharide-degrading enzyme [Pseudomonadota bacterium]